MPKFRPLSLAMRLTATFALVGMFGAAIGLVGIASLTSVRQTSERLYENDLGGALLAQQAQTAIAQASHAQLALTAATSGDDRELAKQALAGSLQSLDKLLGDKRLAESDTALRAALAKAREMADAYIALMLGQPLDAIQFDASVSVEGHFLDTQFQQLRTAVDAIQQARMEQASASIESLSSLQQHAQNIMAALLAAGLLASLALAIVTARRVRRELGGEPMLAATIAGRIAAGDLGSPIALRRGDTSSLLASLARMQAGLRTTIAGIRDTSAGVSVATREIASGNQDLSVRTEQESARLQQATDLMQSLLADVGNARDRASASHGVATSAMAAADDGSATISRLAVRIQELNEHSRAVGEIVDLIESIAFQTNILALNASVEAARAGSHGRGFAVVAAEVRTLAQRSATAARDIDKLIATTVADVEASARLAGDATSAMDGVRRAIVNSESLTAEVLSASESQADKIARVGETLRALDESTQRNAALVEEVAAAATLLHEQADGLARDVSTFRLDQHADEDAASAVHDGRGARSAHRAVDVDLDFSRTGYGYDTDTEASTGKTTTRTRLPFRAGRLGKVGS